MGAEKISRELRVIAVRSSRLLTDSKGDTDWMYFLTTFGFEELAEDVPRLLQSQHFGDPDYAGCVRELFLKVAEEHPDRFVDFVRFVLGRDIDLSHENQRRKDPELVAWLVSGAGSLGPITLPALDHRPLGLTQFPDDFYRDLVGQINRAFSSGVLPAVQILARKLLENLVIDILRKKYGPARLDLYFDKGKRRFQGFEALLKNLSDNLPDFVGSPGLDDALLKRISAFRQQGNAAAHSIELTLDPGQVKSDLAEVEHLAKVLIRVFQSL